MKLSKIIKKLHKGILSEVNVSFQKFTDTEAEQLAQALIASHSVLQLRLHGCTFSILAIQALAEALRQNRSIERLILIGNFIPAEGMTALANALAVNNAVKKLEINRDQPDVFTRANVSDIMRMFKTNTSIQEFEFNNNRLDSEHAHLLGQALKVNNTLKKLYLFGCSLDWGGASALAEELKASQSLSELTIVCDPLSSESILCLADALSVNKNIVNVKLSKTSINNESLRVLASQLQNQGTLIRLDLINNLITDDGVSAVAIILQSNPKLTNLNLAGNEISEKGLLYLAEALHSHANLKELSLSLLNLEMAGMQLLTQLLNISTTLTKFSLGCDQSFDLKALAESLKNNSHLETLTLGMPTITHADFVVLVEMLSVNKTLLHLYINTEIEVDLLGLQQLADTLSQKNRTLQTLEWPTLYSSCSAESKEIEKRKTIIEASLALNCKLKIATAYAACEVLNKMRPFLQFLNNFQYRLPQDIKNIIASYLDEKTVLTQQQIKNILTFAEVKPILYKSKGSFLQNVDCQRYQFFNSIPILNTPAIIPLKNSSYTFSSPLSSSSSPLSPLSSPDYLLTSSSDYGIYQIESKVDNSLNEEYDKEDSEIASKRNKY